jgi:hypothetical protein
MREKNPKLLSATIFPKDGPTVSREQYHKIGDQVLSKDFQTSKTVFMAAYQAKELIQKLVYDDEWIRDRVVPTVVEWELRWFQLSECDGRPGEIALCLGAWRLTQGQDQMNWKSLAEILRKLYADSWRSKKALYIKAHKAKHGRDLAEEWYFKENGNHCNAMMYGLSDGEEQQTS